MKNFTLKLCCTVGFLLVFGILKMDAQTVKSPEVTAQRITAKLNKMLSFDNNQNTQIYQIQLDFLKDVNALGSTRAASFADRYNALLEARNQSVDALLTENQKSALQQERNASAARGRN